MMSLESNSGSLASRFSLRALYLHLWHAGFRWLYLVDALAMLLIMFLVMLVRFGRTWPDKKEIWIGMFIAILILQTIFYFGGLYEKQVRLGQRMWFSRVAGMTLLSLGVLGVLVLPSGQHPIPRGNLPAVGLLSAFAATGNRELSRKLRARRFGPPKVLLVGSREQTQLAADHLSDSDREAVVIDCLSEKIDLKQELLPEIEKSGATDVVFVDDISLESVFPEPARTLEQKQVGAYLRVTAATALIGLREVREISGIPYVTLRFKSLHPHQMRLKRLIELLVILAISPIALSIFIFVSIWLRLVAGSGIILRQKRIGQDGESFILFKFRTMRVDAEKIGKAQLAKSDDERILKGCRWLRKTRLDEIPQFWNVLKGEMSLVGPRPERPEMVSVFTSEIPGYGRRHEIPPGITGLAQTRSGYHTDAAYKLGHDLQYLMSWSPILDVQIIFRTVFVMFRRRL